MVRQALTEKRPWLFAAIVAAIAYFFLRDSAIGGVWLILLKGSAVALLAMYSLQRHPSLNAKLLALVLALSSLGDMLIEITLEAGGAAFFFSHLAAMTLYLTNRRPHTTGSQKGAAVAILILTPLVCWILSRDVGVTFYGIVLGGMAATAWMSRFSRYRVGLGALLFVVSDWFIFTGMSPLSGQEYFQIAVWPLYFLGQFLIATGVIQTLRLELPGAN